MSWWAHGLRPDDSAQGATVFAFLSWQGVLLATAVLMAGFTLARALTGGLSALRTSTMDFTSLFTLNLAAQGTVAALLVRLFPGF